MKIEDLMVGDWIHYKMDLGKDGIYEKDIRITNIYGCEVNCEVRGHEIISGKRLDNLEPIPLTPEILEKNGFKWTGSGDSTGWLSTPWGYDGIRYNIYVGLKKKTIEVHSAHPELRTDSWRKVNKVSLEVCGCFVHELQHALRLCGINHEMIL